MPSKSHPIKPSRWVHEGAADGIDAELSELFRALPPAEPLAPTVIAAVGRRVARGPETGTRRSLRYLPLAFALLAGTAGAVAQWARPSSWHLQQAYVAPPTQVSSRPARAAAAPTVNAARAVDAAPGAIAEPELAAAPVPVPGALARPASVATTAALTASPAVEPPSRLALEAELLQKALAKLRRSHDAKAALTLLDDYQARFPHGQMSSEAGMARIDALLLLGRRAEALALLAGTPLDRVGRRTELMLVRAELYAERDCRRALTDFDAVLAARGNAGLTERALYGRAGCSLRLGNTRAAHADLKAYLARYPGGRFAEEVRARLAVD